MKTKGVFSALVFAAGMAFFAAAPAPADDSAASIAAGGLVPRRETRIVMAKEVLRISPDKVIVDYDFRNDTGQDVTTEVAFPVPPYENGFPSSAISEQAFQSFRLWVDGKPVTYGSEVKATLNGKDVTEILRANDIDIPTFGHFDDNPDPKRNLNAVTHDFDRLSEQRKNELIGAGLFENQGGQVFTKWTVHLQYHWTQTFPAHSTVHIRHEYTPVEGFELMPLDTFKNALESTGTGGQNQLNPGQSEDLKLLTGFCPDPSFLRGVIGRLEAADEQTGRFAYPQWVDFILTSANTWRQPIEDFTLILERGKPRNGLGPRLISFCSPQNAPVTKLDADHFQVHLTNFVPPTELRIGFFDMPQAKPAPASSGQGH